MDPITQQENVIAKLELPVFLRSEDGVDEVVISRFNNSTNELVNGRKVCHYRHQLPIPDVKNLKVFYSYEPKFKHYVFQCGSDMIILRKSKDSLVLHKTFNNVSDFTVEDHLGLGKPQVVVDFLHGDQVITDCNSDSNLAKPESKQIPSFATLVQKSKLRIEHTEQALRDKTRILSKLSSTLAFNCEEDGFLSTVDRLVYLKASLGDSHVGLPAKGMYLSVGNNWLRTRSYYWIIGFPVVNLSKGDMSKFEMYVSHDNMNIKRTLLFAGAETSSLSSTDVFRRSRILFPGKSGQLVVVLEEPHFLAASFALNCVCTFETTVDVGPQQCYLGRVDIVTSDLSSDKYRLSSQTLSTVDIISIQASCKCFELIYKLLYVTRTQFIDALDAVLNCKRIEDGVLANYNTRNSPNFLIVFDEYSDTFETFVDTTNEFLLLLHKIIGAFRGSVLLQHPNSHSAKAIEAMKEEVSFVKKLLEKQLLDSESKTVVNLEEEFREMMLLVMASAHEVVSLKQYSLL